MLVAWPLSPHDNTACLQARLSAAVEGAVLRGISCCCSLTAAGVAVKLRLAVNVLRNWHQIVTLLPRPSGVKTFCKLWYESNTVAYKLNTGMQHPSNHVNFTHKIKVISKMGTCPEWRTPPQYISHCLVIIANSIAYNHLEWIHLFPCKCYANR